VPRRADSGAGTVAALAPGAGLSSVAWNASFVTFTATTLARPGGLGAAAASRYDAVMYLDALSFLEDERDAWRPYESLSEVSDEHFDEPVDGAHGWSARDLVAHMVGWQEVALAVARDLAVGETSPTIARVDAEWEAKGDAMNDEMVAAWRELPAAEVRDRLKAVAGDLRGYLTVVPESRWVKHPTHLETFVSETLEHYDDHKADLEAILAAARR
jgi:hypothetical protein